MPRKYKSTSPFVKPDPKFGDLVVSKFINCVMKRGKKSVAQAIVYEAIDIFAKKFPNEQPLKLFKQAIDNIKPEIEVRSRRVGGATYQVPTDIAPKRQLALSIRWILQAAQSKKGKPMFIALADELDLAYKKDGNAWKKRDNVHKMAEANKAFVHFGW